MIYLVFGSEATTLPGRSQWSRKMNVVEVPASKSMRQRTCRGLRIPVCKNRSQALRLLPERDQDLTARGSSPMPWDLTREADLLTPFHVGASNQPCGIPTSQPGPGRVTQHYHAHPSRRQKLLIVSASRPNSDSPTGVFSPGILLVKLMGHAQLGWGSC